MRLFDRLVWKDDRMILNDYIFRLQHYKNDRWDGGEDHVIFYKIKKLVDQYDKYFRTCDATFAPKNVIEIGMWGGGSIMFWNEILKPEKILGIDILSQSENGFFDQYIEKVNRSGQKIIPSWGTDQADKYKIINLIATHFGDEPLDLVFDDCSHMYEPTLASFNAIFPYMAKGGLYIIEDWAWGHWVELNTGMPVQAALTRLIADIIKATGNEGLIESVTVFEGFAVIKRGAIVIPDKFKFNLYDYILNKV